MGESKPFQPFLQYHLRKTEKAINSRQEMLDVINSQQVLTMAMCRDNEPYLVTMDYGYSESDAHEKSCFYLHCAREGKKLDFLRANPRVWGQVLEDRGYIKGKCGHAFRCVMFEAVAQYVEDPGEMLHALAVMVDKFEPGNDALKQKLVDKAQLPRLGIIRLRVTAMTGKQGPAPVKN